MSYELHPVPKPRPKRKVKVRGLRQHTRIQPRNAKRKGSMFPKRRDPAYQEYLRGSACYLRQAGLRSSHSCWGDVQLCHITSRGAGGYDQANIVPMCAGAHDEQHRIGIAAFQKRHGINLKAEAAYLWARYEQHRGIEQGDARPPAQRPQ